MEQKITSRATEYFSGLNLDQESEVMCSTLAKFFASTDGECFMGAVKRAASGVVNRENCQNAVNAFFFYLKKWAPSPMAMLCILAMFCIFVVYIAALVTFMLLFEYVPVVVVQWGKSLLAMLADHLVSVCNTIIKKTGEFFEGNSLELPAAAELAAAALPTNNPAPGTD